MFITFREKKEDGTFNEDDDIDLNIIYNQRLSEILTTLNARRPNDKKIKEVYNEFDQVIPLTHKVRGVNIFYYKLTPKPKLTI
jgi:hypothetical protein